MGIVQAETKTEDQKASEEEPAFNPDKFRELGANAGQDERRKELIDRLNERGQKKTLQTLGVLWNEKEAFEVSDKKTGKTLRYEWWSMDRMKSKEEFEWIDKAVTAAQDNVGK